MASRFSEDTNMLVLVSTPIFEQADILTMLLPFKKGKEYRINCIYIVVKGKKKKKPASTASTPKRVDRPVFKLPTIRSQESETPSPTKRPTSQELTLRSRSASIDL